MKLAITGKHLEVPIPLKEHIEEKIAKLDKFKLKLIEAHVVLKKEKYLFVAELKILAKRLQVFMIEKGEINFFEAIDKVVHKMEIHLARQKEKIKGHHQGRLRAAAWPESFESEEPRLSRPVISAKGAGPHED